MTTSAQSEEVQQLLLNIEKLAQFKKILQNMYEGYKLLNKGYTAVKKISFGDFNIHKTFLDGLMQVSPAVKEYKRIADIISYQLRIAKEFDWRITGLRKKNSLPLKKLIISVKCTATCLMKV